MSKNRTLSIISLVGLVGAIGYGIVIPIIYQFSQKFHLSDFQNGLLFSIFAVCQFIATPIIGRMSDKYGRRPLLIISLLGTVLSFIMTAFAPNAFFMFFARAIDGITAGTFSVASAVISDILEPHERAKGFGRIMAAFNFGFVFGPGISGLTYKIWDGLPFIIAAVITAIAVILIMLFLPETNKHIGKVAQGKLFDFKHMFGVLGKPKIGKLLLISFVYFFAFMMFVYSFMPFSSKVLHLDASRISFIFVLFGIMGLLSQMVFIGKFEKWFGMKNTFYYTLTATATGFALLFFSHNLVSFIIFSLIVGFFNGFVPPLTQAILANDTPPHEQGAIMGFNASYQSLGQIIGPIAGGAIAIVGLRYPFLLAGVFMALCLYLTNRVFHGER
jgi:multidrug resistance protein